MPSLLFSVSFCFIILCSATTPNEQIQKAILICREKLSADPDFPKAQHMLGMLLEQQPDQDVDPHEIATLFWKAGTAEDRPLDESKRIDNLVRGAAAFQILGDTEKSADCYYEALKLATDSDTVTSLLRQAASLLLSQPAIIEKINGLDQILVQRFPAQPSVHQFRGALLRKQGLIMEAYGAYQDAVAAHSSGDDNNNPAAMVQSCILAAAAAKEAGVDMSTQMEYLEKAAQIPIDDNAVKADLYNNMGIVQKSAGEVHKAIEFFRVALEANPGDGHALAQLASLDADVSSVTGFDEDYVSGLFDGYSARFEDELVNTLEYKGHEMVVETLRSIWKESLCPAEPSEVVDLGCGTGLVGEEIKRLNPNVNIRGIDLSERMVAIATARTLQGNQVYASVEKGDAGKVLANERSGSIDAIVAADVFIYVGDINDIVSASSSCLRSGGLLVFSVESIEQGMRLLPSGRFGHSREYIEAVAKQFGFELMHWKDGVLRKQRGTEVKGAAVALRKT